MYYCDSKHTIIFANSLVQKVLILKTKVIIEEANRIIKITREPFSKTSNNEKKKLKVVQGTQVSLLKQMLLDMSHFSCIKLNLIGVGFRVSTIKIESQYLLHFKIGYSHFIYFKIPKSLKRIFIYHNVIRFISIEKLIY